MPASTPAPERRRARAPEPVDQAALVESLRRAAVSGGAAELATVVETHISYVLLAGAYAYKIRKAVDLQFLDFTTLAARRYDCQEELRLNQPLAPSIYVDVVTITGTVDDPVIGGDGPVLEYAVRMRQFPHDALLSDMLARGALTPAHIDQLATTVTTFHLRTARTGVALPWGTPDGILQPALQNFTQLLAVVRDAEGRSALEALRAWTEREHAACVEAFLKRRQDGFVRECHGDLHLGNIACVDGEVTLFDRLEFNESMRWIDVMNDVAFVVMDLQERMRADLAARFLNAYLETTGDYEGLQVLRFYLVYRAMVRAKVARLRVGQVGAGREARTGRGEYHGYLELARRLGQRASGAILITHGLAGSGKTTCAQTVIERTAAIRIRTDVERKRLYGLPASASSDSPVDGGLYSAEATERTYAHVCSLARSVAAAGYTVIVDGTFLKRAQRDLFRKAAVTLGLPFVIIAVTAPLDTLRARVAARRGSGAGASEATLAVLEWQIEIQEPLGPDERSKIVNWGTGESGN